MPRPGVLFIAAVLFVLIALAFARPQLMLAPGPVVSAHAAVAEDCFACHAPWEGAAAKRCTGCHAPARIGIFTTKGVTLPAPKLAFHQQLIEPDCMACHTDHAGPALVGHNPAKFSHDLLKPAVRSRCGTCHAAPTGPLHGPLHRIFADAPCSECHRVTGWTPAAFNHQLLTPTARSRCITCHKPPSNTLHRQTSTIGCSRCHTTMAWEPATFDHDRLFRLDRDHDVPCATCHVAGNYARYTCYGCHEHEPARVAAEHREEGVRGNIENCVRCHRSADDEPREGRGGGDDED